MEQYFSHKSNTHNNPKILELRIRHGMSGYGVYFYLLEKLVEGNNCSLDYQSLAYEIHVEVELLKSVIEDFGLFTISEDGKSFSSIELKEQYEQKDSIRKKRAEAGRAGGLAKAQNKKKETVANAKETVANAKETVANAKETVANAKETVANAKETVANAKETVANTKEEKETEKEKVSPTPPIKEKDKEKEMSYQTDSGQPTAGNLHQRCRKFFEAFTSERYPEDYYWQAKDAGQLKILLNAIRFTRKSHKSADGRADPRPVDDESMFSSFKAFVEYAYNKGDTWLLGNFTIPNLSSRYNSLRQTKNRTEINGTYRRKESGVPIYASKDEYDKGFTSPVKR